MQITRTMIRFIAVFVTFGLSSGQFRFFDCNKMPALSFASGALTLLLLYATGEATYRVITSTRPGRDKAIIGACLVLVGAAFVAGAGFFTLITHLCP